MTSHEKATKLAHLGCVPANVGGWRIYDPIDGSDCVGEIGEIRQTYLGPSVCVRSGPGPSLPNTHPDYRPIPSALWAAIPNEPWDGRYISADGLAAIQ